MTTPYTYLIKHVPTDTYYYGIRYAHACNPNEFWNKYKTSSKHVKKLIEIYGADSFEYEIRKTFNDVDSARKWESTVLRRLDAANRKEFINKTDNISISSEDAERGRKNRISTLKHKEAVSKVGKANKNRIASLETRNRISKSLLGNTYKLGVKESDISKLKKSLSKIGKPSGMLGKKQSLCSCLRCKKIMPYPNFIQHFNKNH